MFDVINEQISAPLFCSIAQASHHVRKRGRSASVLEGAPFVREAEGNAPGTQPPGESFLCTTAEPRALSSRSDAVGLLFDLGMCPSPSCAAKRKRLGQGSFLGAPCPHRPLHEVHQPFHWYRNLSLRFRPTLFWQLFRI